MERVKNFFIQHPKLIYFSFFIALFFLCFLFPFVHDDWAWGSRIGLDRLYSGFADYGGRYFGYFIVLVMTRSHILKALIMSSTIIGIGILIEKIVQRKWAFLLSILLIFLVAKATFAQAISWTSGFANYVTSSFFVLFFVYLSFKTIQDDRETPRYLPFVSFIMAFLGSLIVEHATVYLVLMSLLVQIYLWMHNKRFSLVLSLFFIGALLGVLLMFSNSAYGLIVGAQDSYRSITSSDGISSRVLTNYVGSIYPYGLLANTILNVALALALVFFYRLSPKTKINTVSISVFSVYAVYSVFNNLFLADQNKPESLLIFEGIFSFIALAFLVFSSLKLSRNSKDKNLSTQLSFAFISFIIMVGQLFFITPIGPRCFFAPYVLLVLVVCLLLKEVSDQSKFASKSLSRFTIFSCVVVYVIYLSIFSTVFYVNQLRVSYVHAQVAQGITKVKLRELPFSTFMWHPTPNNDIFKERFKLFYNLPEDLVIDK